MGLSLKTLQQIRHLLTPGKTVLSLAYPDVLLTVEECRQYTGKRPTQFTNAGATHSINRPLPETREFFANLGCKFTCTDFKAGLNADIVADLNEPHDFGRFDVVLDAGTTEHCFNVAQAMHNAASAVAVGGHIMHETPRDMPNHGFFNFTKVFYKDFYSQNGWQIHRLENFGRTWLVIAQRMTDAPIRYPTQGCYLKS